MAKYYGQIGYATVEETSPGVWVEEITERNYYGDVVRNRVNVQQGTTVNAGVTISKQISIIADPFAFENFTNMRYITYLNQKWSITGVDVEHPRLILTIGGVYNGQ